MLLYQRNGKIDFSQTPVFFGHHLDSGTGRVLVYCDQFSCWVDKIHQNFLKKRKSPGLSLARIQNDHLSRVGVASNQLADALCESDFRLHVPDDGSFQPAGHSLGLTAANECRIITKIRFKH